MRPSGWPRCPIGAEVAVETPGTPLDRPGADRPRRAGTTRVVLPGDLDPFQRLTPPERTRLLVRVLCELVAYGADEDADARLAS